EPLSVTRTLAVGPELQPGGGTHFRVWAPKRRSVEVVFSDGRRENGKSVPLESEDDGYFSALIPEAAAGTRYKLRVDGKESFPDPASHWQPDGPHGASAVIDHHQFSWSDKNWRGVSIRGQVIYE